MSTNRTSRKAIYLMIICTLFTSTGQILWKLGAMEINPDYLWTVFNLPFMFGFVSYGFGAILMLLAFRRGELSILYPLVATSYVWVSLASPFIFPTDTISTTHWVGITVILGSLGLLGYSAKRETREETL